jgi:hypothetical protein
MRKDAGISNTIPDWGTPKLLFKLPGPLVGNPPQWKNASSDGQRFVFAMPPR